MLWCLSAAPCKGYTPAYFPIAHTFLILNFALNVVDAVRRLHLKGDSLARQGLPAPGEKLQSTTEPCGNQTSCVSLTAA